MTKERFFQLAKECGIDPECEGVVNMWDWQPTAVREAMDRGEDDSQLESQIEELLTGFFAIMRKTVISLNAHSKALNN